MSQRLANGWTLEQRGDIWLIWERLGRCVYVGDGAGALEILEVEGL